MNWLLPANSKMYDHASSFAHFGSIDWRQGNTRYSVGDIVYIYCTAPIKSIRYKCRVAEINRESSTIRDDQEYWLDKDEWLKSLGGKYFTLQLLEEAESTLLSYQYLLKNGLNGAPQGALKLSNTLESYIASIFATANDEDFPETIESSPEIFEGIKRQVSVNKYERSSIARAKCIEAHGHICKVCTFDFEKFYGPVGKEFIHVHHVIPIHTIGRHYKIDYVNDLIPVCPNCHAMLHRRSDGSLLSVQELKSLLGRMA